MTAKSPLSALSAEQRAQVAELERLALDFNVKHNLYSEGSARAFHLRHTEHSLMLATRDFPAGSTVVDWGTGGGMPGIPLAIAFPGVTFHLVDAVDKKVRSVRAIARRLGLTNVQVWHSRAEEWEGSAHFSVSRATAPLDILWGWHQRIAIEDEKPWEEKNWPLGLICLKGGNLSDEVSALKDLAPGVSVETTPVAQWLKDPYFLQKMIILATAP